jgi:hypothetical protein
MYDYATIGRNISGRHGSPMASPLMSPSPLSPTRSPSNTFPTKIAVPGQLLNFGASTEAQPQNGTALPQNGTALPQNGTALPQNGTTLPQNGTAHPQNGTAHPQNGGPAEAKPQNGSAVETKKQGGDSISMATPRIGVEVKPSGGIVPATTQPVDFTQQGGASVTTQVDFTQQGGIAPGMAQPRIGVEVPQHGVAGNMSQPVDFTQYGGVTPGLAQPRIGVDFTQYGGAAQTIDLTQHGGTTPMMTRPGDHGKYDPFTSATMQPVGFVTHGGTAPELAQPRIGVDFTPQNGGPQAPSHPPFRVGPALPGAGGPGLELPSGVSGPGPVLLPTRVGQAGADGARYGNDPFSG